MKLHSETIQALADAGIEFVANIRVPGGGRMMPLEVGNVAAFVRDPIAFAAELHRASTDQYLDWVENDGTARCGAKTASGARCRNVISGVGQLDFEAWLQLDGGFCAVHGGDTSKEARQTKRHRS